MTGAATVHGPHSNSFPPEKRLRKRSDFAQVYSRGRQWSHPAIRLRVLPNHGCPSRFGFAVGKHVGKAVVRNRLKRRLREVVRQAAIRPGYDVVVTGRPAATATTYLQLRTALMDMLARARLLAPS